MTGFVRRLDGFNKSLYFLLKSKAVLLIFLSLMMMISAIKPIIGSSRPSSHTKFDDVVPMIIASSCQPEIFKYDGLIKKHIAQDDEHLIVDNHLCGIHPL